jgi:alpha-beta hydrolase superfamily lysophospholipase
MGRVVPHAGIWDVKSIMFRIVEFASEGAILRGRLYLSQTASMPQPVVVMAHGFSATIDGMVAEKYAEVFHEAGLAVLLYDHRSFGISGGEPRQQINRWVQARGYRDAINFIVTLPEIDQDHIAVWGDSLSAGVAIVVGAIDERVKAVVAQVPACGEQLPPDDPDGSLFEAIKDTFLHGDLTRMPVTTIGPCPVVSFDQRSVPSLLTPLTAFHWFMEYGARYGTNWENCATLVTLQAPAPFHPLLCAPYLKVPTLMLIAAHDEMPGANSDVARMTFQCVPEPKQKIEIDGGHFGLLYYPGELFEQVSSAQRNFLTEYLK